MSGVNCCRCGREIDFWIVFKSIWPTRVFCSHCKAQNSYKYGHFVGFLFTLLALVLASLVFVVSDSVMPESSSDSFLVLWVIIFVTLLELLLLLVTGALRRYGLLSGVSVKNSLEWRNMRLKRSVMFREKPVFRHSLFFLAFFSAVNAVRPRRARAAKCNVSRNAWRWTLRS